MGEAVSVEEPYLNLFFSTWSLKNKCSAFPMASKQKERVKRKCVNLSKHEKLELIKNLVRSFGHPGQ